MRRFVFAALILCAGQVSAQERVEMTTCQQGWSAVASGIAPEGPDAQISVTDDGWCLIDNLTLQMDHNSSFKVETLRWRASDMARVVEQGLPPRSLEIVGVGFSFPAQTGDPVLDYLLELQSSVAESGFGLSVRWDGVQNAVFVDELYVDFFAGNRIEATARVDDVDLTDQTTMQISVGSMGLRDLVVTTQLAGWFETFVAMPLGPALLNSEGAAPEVQVRILQEQAVEFVNNIPDSIVPPTSREALGAFIQDLPEPRGTARLQLSANPPLGAARMTPFALLGRQPTMDEIVELGLEGVDLLFTWTPMEDGK
ncbi:MAG TPA: hypothetical protein DIT67_08415 [Octadecabacter sp.]|nr:hypothetical protein [Octadecabacter sp.]